jgi:membrane protein
MIYYTLRRFIRLVSTAFENFSNDRGQNAAAALAFFSLLSLAPLILIAVAVAGLLMGEAAAREEMQRLVVQHMGSVAAKTVDGWVSDAVESGGTASVVALGLMLWTATQGTSQLRESLNQVWNVGPPKSGGGFKATVLQYLKRQGLAVGLVLTSGLLLLAAFASRIVLSVIPDVLFAGSPVGTWVAGIFQFLLSLAIVAVASAFVFRFVPDAKVDWNSAFKGGVLTSVLFNIGNLLVGLYLGHVGGSNTYGVAGSVVVLLWLYYSGQMMLFGAEVTQICCEENAKPASDTSLRGDSTLARA